MKIREKIASIIFYSSVLFVSILNILVGFFAPKMFYYFGIPLAIVSVITIISLIVIYIKNKYKEDIVAPDTSGVVSESTEEDEDAMSYKNDAVWHETYVRLGNKSKSNSFFEMAPPLDEPKEETSDEGSKPTTSSDETEKKSSDDSFFTIAPPLDEPNEETSDVASLPDESKTESSDDANKPSEPLLKLTEEEQKEFESLINAYKKALIDEDIDAAEKSKAKASKLVNDAKQRIKNEEEEAEKAKAKAERAKKLAEARKRRKMASTEADLLRRQLLGE